MVKSAKTSARSRPQSAPAGHAYELGLGDIISNPFATCVGPPLDITSEALIPCRTNIVVNERSRALEAISNMLAQRLGEGPARRTEGNYEIDDDDQSSIFMRQRQVAARAAAQRLGCRDLRGGERPRTSALTRRSKSLLNSANLRCLATRYQFLTLTMSNLDSDSTQPDQIAQSISTH